MSSRSPICAMCLSASSRARPRPTSLTRCYPGLGRPHRPRPPSRADARGAVATLTDNCQVAVSLSLANHDTTLPVAYRLYLPEEWAKDRQRRHQAKVPETIAFQAKPQIALEQIKAARAAGLLARQGSSRSTWTPVRARHTASRTPAPTRAILVASVITR